ncbi:MAG: pilus assembly protein PilZ [Methylophaga sp.]|nr:MAG: pilus assembly protein PilZ [Methylophaga sp.]
MPEFNSDRREYFRINDTIILRCKPIDKNKVEQLGFSINNPLQSNDSQNHVQLRTLQIAFTHLTDQISQNDREVARALRLLDEKINLIGHTLLRQQSDDEKNDIIEANLSGGGLAFLSAESIEVKTPVEVHIELRPSGIVIHALANVVSCNNAYERSEQKPYLLRLAFTHMSEIDRNALVKHTLSRQAENLRSAQE